MEKLHVYDQGRQFVFKCAGDNNLKLECGLKSAGFDVSLQFIVMGFFQTFGLWILGGFFNPRYTVACS